MVLNNLREDTKNKTFLLPKRNLGVEFLRIVAILFVIAQHVFQFVLVGVALFFGITGTFIKPDKASIKKQIYKLLFYLIFYLPIFIIIRVAIWYGLGEPKGFLDPWSWLISFQIPADGRSNWWYLFAIIGGLLVHYLTIEKYTEKNKWIIFVFLCASFFLVLVFLLF